MYTLSQKIGHLNMLELLRQKKPVVPRRRQLFAGGIASWLSWRTSCVF